MNYYREIKGNTHPCCLTKTYRAAAFCSDLKGAKPGSLQPWLGMDYHQVMSISGVDRTKIDDFGWRYSKEGRSASFASLWCQYSVTFNLHSFLNWVFGIGSLSNSRGFGNSYCTHRSRNIWNQDFEEGFDPIKVLMAMLFNMFPGRWHIMLNKDN